MNNGQDLKLRRAEAALNRELEGGEEPREGILASGACQGAVGDEMGFNCSNRSEVGSNSHCSCGLRVSRAVHVLATKGN